MKLLVALAMGFCSGLLLYFLAALVFSSSSSPPSAVFSIFVFIGGWTASTYLMLKGALSTSKVFSRGFLIGAAEWFSLLPVGIVFAGKAVATAGGSSGAQLAGAAIGGGIMAFLTGGLAIGMTLFCLLGFAISYSLGREMRPESLSNDGTSSPVPAMRSRAQPAVLGDQFTSRTLYEVLGVDAHASAEEIEAASIGLGQMFLAQSKTGSLQAAIRLKEVEQAFEVLGNPEKRVRFDVELGL